MTAAYSPATATAGPRGIIFMSEQKQRPANVPEENVYNGVHWLVIATYAAAIGGVAMLMMGAG